MIPSPNTESRTVSNLKQGLSTTVAVAVLGFLSICVAVIGVLSYGGKDAGPLISFIVAVIPATVGVILVSRQTEQIQRDVTEVKEQTNGQLDRKFEQVHERMDASPAFPTRDSMDSPDRH